MKTKDLIQIALKSGEILLCNGAEVYRVEETILRIFKSYGSDCECFVLLSGIFLSAKDENGETITEIRRLKGHTINLNKVDLVNSFSRNLEKLLLSYQEALEVLKKIECTPIYSYPLRLVCTGITAFVYTILFRGRLEEALTAFFISLVIFVMREKITLTGIFQFLEFFLSGTLAGFLSLMAVILFPGLDIYKIIIGSIMILVPGVAITNGIKDALYGDTVSSLYRIAEAIFVSVAIGAGVGIVLSAGLRWLYG